MFYTRITKMLDKFSHHIELDDHEYSAVRENFELKVLRITWQEHDMGSRFVPQKAKSSAYMQVPPEAFQKTRHSSVSRFSGSRRASCIIHRTTPGGTLATSYPPT
ncbi:hypothetical protein NP493_874g01001 [Ridgeia piscesae]|uniref:Uncharacterized protein n=1 Tax=Ridgeia piscesae TaxID=27915 RepID=A0AAD9KLN8_RIDPI|nr:hypothetical protein NP493_874g01001 [Ridgeia piscesae]